MKPSDERDQLWDLLGKAPSRTASPYFARRVVNTVRAEQQAQARAGGFMRWFRWVAPISAVAAVAIVWTADYSAQKKHQEEVALYNAYFDKAADLQSLVVSTDESSWIASGN